MAEDGVKDDKNLAAGGNLAASAELNKGSKATKPRRGILSRIWNGMFRTGEDFEKRLQYLSKEEASVHVRIKRRAKSWRRTARNVISFSIVLEVFLIGYAIIATRTLGLDWKMRAVRVLPMFILPGLSYAIYSMLSSFTRMLERKDQKTLERLRAERQAKIDELKERTNYYSTQQLIQRYDLDPAAKAAAASVLAHKLGADSGLKVSVGEESHANMPIGKSNDVQVVQSSGLRNRRPTHSRSSSTGSITMPQIVEESTDEFGIEGKDVPAMNQTVVVGHYQQSATSDGGWLARIAALLVGEDPTQCFALICGNCHMHNGLARKEDFSYITYYCPHCHALNGSQQPEGPAPGPDFGSSPGSTSSSKKVSPRPSNDDLIELSGADDIIGHPNSPPLSDSEVATISKTALDD